PPEGRAGRQSERPEMRVSGKREGRVDAPPRGGNRRRFRAASFAALALVALVAAAGPTAAPGDGSGTTATRFQRIDPATVGLNDGIGKTFVPASMSDNEVSVTLQMAGNPVAVESADAKKQGKKLSASEEASIRTNLKAKQDAILAPIQQAGGTV